MSLQQPILIEDRATPAIAARIAALQPAYLSARIGPACADLTRRHIAALGKNKRGWPSTGFNEGASDSTRWEGAADGTHIRVRKIGARQRRYGGHIAPVHARALTIPISPVAYGHTASEFPGLFLLKAKGGAYLVQHGQKMGGESYRSWVKRKKTMGGNARRRIQAMLQFLFKLSGGVDQEPNPDFIPSMEASGQTAKTAILRP